MNKLKKNYSNDSKIKTLNEFINTTDNNLDKIIQKYNIKKIDLLSIDIDGRDLSVWKTLNKIKPKFVIIEYNQFIPFDVEYEDTTNKFVGSSALAIYNYAKSMNYELIGATSANLIFIEQSFNNKTIENINIENLYNLIKPLRIGHNWKGEMLFFKNNELKIKEYFTHPQQKNIVDFQTIPKFIRKFLKLEPTDSLVSILNEKHLPTTLKHFLIFILK